MIANEANRLKTVFIIMPFSKANKRNQKQLTNFFNILKSSIEAENTLKYKYTVNRSGDDFNITDQLIRNLFNADIIIADISGKVPNPNVMYELGVRLAISEKPVIMIREGDKNDRSGMPFDIETYHTEFYDPLKCEELVRILVDKLKRIESGEMQYESPVKKALLYSNNQAYNIFSQREKLSIFCSRVIGSYWQRIAEKSYEEGKMENSLSYVKFVPDEVTNEVKISGETYNKQGKFIGKWESLAVGIIMDSSTKIFYYWEAKHKNPPGKITKGFGEFDNFKLSNDVFIQADGRFMNTYLLDERKSWWKDVSIKRIHKEEDIRKMDVGSDNDKRSLVEEILENWSKL
jgi:hypothetical protein